MSKSERQLQQVTLMKERWQEIAEQQRQTRFDDFVFLTESGVGIEEAAKRVGTNPVALARQAYRWGRVDLGRILNPSARRQRLGL